MKAIHGNEKRNQPNVDTGIEGKRSLLLKHGFFLLTKPTRRRQHLSGRPRPQTDGSIMTRIPGISLGTTLMIHRFCMSERSGLIASKLGFGHQVFPDLTVQTAQKSVSSDQIYFILLHIAIYIKAENVPEKKLKQRPFGASSSVARRFPIVVSGPWPQDKIKRRSNLGTNPSLRSEGLDQYFATL